MKYDEIILITGCARSGTSLVAGTLYLCGASGGNLRTEGNKNNRKGFFENLEIRNGLIKPLLRRIGYDPMGQDPLPDIEKMKRLLIPSDSIILKQKVEEILQEQKCGQNPMYKGAKNCLIWPLWHAAFPHARWVVVRRDPNDIVNSCLRTSFMRAFRTRAGWLGWVAEHEKRFEEMHDSKLNILEVWPQRAINGDLTELQLVVNALGLNWNFDKIREFVTPSLWHRAKRE